MSQGDVKSAISSITANSGFTIQPPAGEEWALHTVDLTYAFGFRIKTATLTASIETWAAGHWALSPPIHLTNSVYIELSNTDSAAGHLASYMGVQTK